MLNEEMRFEEGRHKVPIWECLFVHNKTRIILTCSGGRTNGWIEEYHGTCENLFEKKKPKIQRNS